MQILTTFQVKIKALQLNSLNPHAGPQSLEVGSLCFPECPSTKTGAHFDQPMIKLPSQKPRVLSLLVLGRSGLRSPPGRKPGCSANSMGPLSIPILSPIIPVVSPFTKSLEHPSAKPSAILSRFSKYPVF